MLAFDASEFTGTIATSCYSDPGRNLSQFRPGDYSGVIVTQDSIQTDPSKTKVQFLQGFNKYNYTYKFGSYSGTIFSTATSLSDVHPRFEVGYLNKDDTISGNWMYNHTGRNATVVKVGTGTLTVSATNANQYILNGGTLVLMASANTTCSGDAVITEVEGMVVVATPTYDEDDETTLVSTTYTLAEKTGVAKIGDTAYETFAAAIEAVQDGETITLLSDVTNEGISIDKQCTFTVDFGGYTYTVKNPGAGSAGTKTCGFQLLKDQTITFKNGTIAIDESNKDLTWASTDTSKGIAMLIQNYANLSLVDMTIDGANIAHNGATTRYVVSCNSGTVGFTGSTSITAADGDVAFDTCKFTSGTYTYATPSITVDTTGTITGTIELSGGNLTLTTGTLNGSITIGDGIGDGVVTKADTFTATAPDGYEWDSDGKLVEKAAAPAVPDVCGDEDGSVTPVVDEETGATNSWEIVLGHGGVANIPAGVTVPVHITVSTAIGSVWAWTNNAEVVVTYTYKTPAGVDMTGAISEDLDEGLHQITMLGLKANVDVKVGDETVNTTPTIAEADDGAIEDGVMTVKSIPGLVYRLMGAETLGGLADLTADDALKTVTGTTTKLEAGDAALDTASGFYKVTVDLK